MSKRCYTLAQLLEAISMSRRAFYDARAAGRLPFVEELEPRIGGPRFRADLIDRYLEGRWTGPRHLTAGRKAS
jgi:hypothetical protein